MANTENFTVVKGSYGYPLNFTLKDSAGVARNMTGYTSKLQVWNPLVPETLLIDAACTWTAIASGTCYYTVLNTNFTAAGVFCYAIKALTASIVDTALSGFITVVQYETNYCTLEEIKSELDVDTTGKDDIIQRMIPQAKELIDDLCERNFNKVETTRYFDGSESPLTIDDLVSMDEVGDGISLDEDGDGVYESTMAASDFMLYPYNTSPKTKVFISGYSSYGSFASGVRKGVKIIGTFGWPSVPEVVRRSAIIQVCRWFKRRESAFADVIGSAESGNLTIYKGLDPDIKVNLLRLLRLRY